MVKMPSSCRSCQLKRLAGVSVVATSPGLPMVAIVTVAEVGVLVLVQPGTSTHAAVAQGT